MEERVNSQMGNVALALVKPGALKLGEESGRMSSDIVLRGPIRQLPSL